MRSDHLGIAGEGARRAGLVQPYWFTTNIGLGIGVTAASREEALAIVASTFGASRRILRIEPIADMRELDHGHVVPNMGNWFERGIWFPLGHK